MKMRLVSPAVYVQVVFFLIGVWLVVSPFAMSTQPVNGSWEDATINNVAAGGVLIVLSLLGTLIPLGISLSSAIKEIENRSQKEPSKPQASGG